MTAKDLALWILDQPESIQNGIVTTIVYNRITQAKRAVAFQYKDASGSGIYIESMGAHIKDSEGEKISTINFLNH